MSVLIVPALTENQAVAIASGLVMLKMACDAALSEAYGKKDVEAYLRARVEDIEAAVREIQKATDLARKRSDVAN